MTKNKMPSIIDQTRPDQTRPDQTRPDYNYAQNSRRKILLVTLYGNFNFGNILQRCALTSILESFGFEVEHLCHVSLSIKPFKVFRNSIKRKIKTVLRNLLAAAGIPKYKRRVKEVKEQKEIRKQTEPREKLFKSFQDNHTGRKIFMTIREALCEPKAHWGIYDYAVTGSDQVWHGWTHTREELEYYYLEFMPREKRISYAPSFGFSKFPESDVEFHRKGLQCFDKISCREESMRTLIKNLTGQESELALDPTLLLNREQWKKFASKPKYNLPDKYLLCYVLGKITEEYERAINEAAGDLPVFHIYDTGSPHAKKDSPQWLMHPGEFLYLFEHADFVCTDSFHGAAFSVNFGKNFLAFRRTGAEDMFGRIESLLSHTGLMNHIYESGMKLPPEKPDNESVNQKLEAMRESSMRYLRSCLKV